MVEKIYNNADDKNVGYICFYDNGEGVLYYDEDLENAVELKKVVDYFCKGLLVVIGEGTYTRPIGVTVSGDAYTLVYGEAKTEEDSESEEESPEVSG